MSKHLFLTGRKQVGKSTVLRRLIEKNALDCAGFETRLLMIDGVRRGFMLHGRVDMPAQENDCIVCVRTAERRSVPVPEVFNENGAKILQLSRAGDAPYILMDEIGKLEGGEGAFGDEIMRCLDSGKTVLGVLQMCDSELEKRISARSDVQVITVTEDNREDVFLKVCEMYR